MLNRRSFLDLASELGLASTLFPGVLWAIAEKQKEITSDMIDQAAAIAGIAIPDEAKSMLVEGLSNNGRRVESIRALRLPNSVAPALVFDPVLPGMKFAERSHPNENVLSACCLEFRRAQGFGGSCLLQRSTAR